MHNSHLPGYVVACVVAAVIATIVIADKIVIACGIVDPAEVAVIIWVYAHRACACSEVIGHIAVLVDHRSDLPDFIVNGEFHAAIRRQDGYLIEYKA
jgi:hypothetical protein